MLLSARVISDFQSVNSFRYATEAVINEGDATSFYFQLVDLDQLLQEHGYEPAGLRYVPPAGSTVTVQFQNLDAARQFTRGAVAATADDRSLWRVPILATDPLSGTQALKVTVVEPGPPPVVRSFFLPAALLVRATNLGC